MEQLGWIINWQKSDLTPECKKTFLGVCLDSRNRISLLLENKLEAIQFQIRLLLERRASIRTAMKVLGLMTACIPCVRWAQFHSRPLQRLILSKWDRRQSSLDSSLRLTYPVQRSLLWWKQPEKLRVGVLWSTNPYVVVTTDAWSWGAHLKGRILQGRWPADVVHSSSNFKELYSVWEALRRNQHTLKNCHIRILSDNVTAVSFLKHQGGSRHYLFQELAGRIFRWAEKSVLSISAIHLEGSQNVIPDYLSRRRVFATEWELNQEIFQDLCRHWGTPSIDLFANRRNSKVSRFFSLNPQDLPEGIDALSQEWTEPLSYVFPPLALVPAVLRKIKEDRASHIDCTILAEKELVLSSGGSGNREPSRAPSQGRCNPPGSGVPPESRESPSLCMDPERNILKARSGDGYYQIQQEASHIGNLF
ncbi:uncharacterized protein [Ranitomeya imitator]|uniref:uncharacterized protein n=1 Tax=Ranitomeya imitator TaxID=111125 RepID=UPI0037E872F4